MKILLIDIETAPSLVHVWGLWQQNVAINQIIKPGYTLCYAAKWYGDHHIYFDSIANNTPKKMLKGLHEMLEEADAIVHYNGSRFDIPTIQKDFITHGYLPPSPSKQIDLLNVVKSKFRFPSNKLDYVAQALGLGKKVKHSGHELWIGCMNDDPACWSVMEEYNIGDVMLLEALYEKVRPWVRGHANHSLYSDDKLVCTNCGSDRLKKRGFQHTLSTTFQRYCCSHCGAWCRDNKPLNRKQFKTVGIS
jgi:hypothetical protein